MAKVSPTQFIAQVRAEASKVVWPSRKETALTTVMVLVLTAVVSLFFFLVDQLLGAGVQAVLDLRL
ncbi:MAG: preprotein translocase subunit SecE [Pseudomonadota bacterium]